MTAILWLSSVAQLPLTRGSECNRAHASLAIRPSLSHACPFPSGSLLPPALPRHCRHRSPPPSSTVVGGQSSSFSAPGFPFTAWRRHHRRGHPHGAVRPCQAFTVHPSPSSLFLSPFPSLSIYHLLVFLPWRRRLGERRWCYSVFAGPFAATSTHQVCPPLPFLICETEHPKP